MTRSPMKRRYADKEDIAMNLPEGKTCQDCKHFNRCNQIYGHIADDEVCDWHPSKFREVKP